MVPVASYSAAQLYHRSASDSEKDSPGTDTSKNSDRDRNSGSSDTEASGYGIGKSTPETSVDDDAASSEQPSKRSGTDGHYALAMPKRQIWVAQAESRRHKQSQERMNQDDSVTVTQLGRESGDTPFVTTADASSKDRWYYPQAMALTAQSSRSPAYMTQASPRFNSPTTTNDSTIVNGRPVRYSDKDSKAWCSLCRSISTDQLCQSRHSTVPSGIYGGFFAPQQQQMPRPDWQRSKQHLMQEREVQQTPPVSAVSPPPAHSRHFDSMPLGSPNMHGPSGQLCALANSQVYYPKAMAMPQTPRHLRYNGSPDSEVQTQIPSTREGAASRSTATDVNGAIYSHFFTSAAQGRD